MSTDKRPNFKLKRFLKKCKVCCIHLSFLTLACSPQSILDKDERICQRNLKAEWLLYWHYDKKFKIYKGNAGISTITWPKTRKCLQTMSRRELIKLFGIPHINSPAILTYYYVPEWIEPPENPKNSVYSIQIELNENGQFRNGNIIRPHHTP